MAPPGGVDFGGVRPKPGKQLMQSIIELTSKGSNFGLYPVVDRGRQTAPVEPTSTLSVVSKVQSTEVQCAEYVLYST